MVTFVCFNCDKTLKKKQVEPHFNQCRAHPKLSCIDCKKIFEGKTFDAHITCKSEAEQFHGQYYKPKQKQVKQEVNNNQSQQNQQANASSTSTNNQLKQETLVNNVNNNQQNGKQLNKKDTKISGKMELKNEKLEKLVDSSKLDTKNDAWLGWKKTIRKQLQKLPNKEMLLSKLENIVINLFKEQNVNSDLSDKEIKEVFKRKIKNAKFQVIDNIKIKFIPKSQRK